MKKQYITPVSEVVLATVDSQLLTGSIRGDGTNENNNYLTNGGTDINEDDWGDAKRYNGWDLVGEDW